MKNTMERNWEYAVAEAASQNISQEFLDLDISDVILPDSLTERVAKLFEEEAARLLARKRLIRRRVAAIIIAAVVAALTACICIPTIREKLYRIVITYHDKYFSYKSEPMDTDEPDSFVTDGSSESRDTATADTESAPTTETTEPAFVKKTPSYLPEGYVLGQDLSNEVVTHILFFNASTCALIQYEQYPAGTSQYKSNFEGTKVEKIDINGHSGMIAVTSVDNNNATVLFWNDGQYDYFINSPLSVDETIKIANSIT